MSTSSCSEPSPFLAMPLELRQRIYQLCIPKNVHVIISGGVCYKAPYQGDFTSVGSEICDGLSTDSVETSKAKEISTITESLIGNAIQDKSALPQLLLLCHQITDEVKALLYNANIFQINVPPGGELDTLKLFGREPMDQLRKVVLVFEPENGLGYPGSHMDPKAWDVLLGKLLILGIIIDQLEPPTPNYTDEDMSDDDLEERTAWLTPNLDYLSRAVPETTKIIVDVNKVDLAAQLVEKALPSRFTFQKLLAGDYIFRRGRYSGYSDYDDDTSWRDCVDDCDYDLYDG
ncbi:hypothetical protein NW762_010959 [Fusarium torreyae]|uniref:DUF7730 domain-containing protein n=1 Tax=Fusarium torreyae TaxID=1237075 RepID=A0A9W8RQD7_9HYPO|nr:hypothetical protein NW762_010959 [Fusarium torreyae]